MELIPKGSHRAVIAYEPELGRTPNGTPYVGVTFALPNAPSDSDEPPTITWQGWLTKGAIKYTIEALPRSRSWWSYREESASPAIAWMISHRSRSV